MPLHGPFKVFDEQLGPAVRTQWILATCTICGIETARSSEGHSLDRLRELDQLLEIAAGRASPGVGLMDSRQPSLHPRW